MNVPGPVEDALGGEAVAAEVPLGGDDALYVTQTRTLVYTGDGLLSDESVEEYPHDAERVSVSESRRKTNVVLDYPVEGEQSFSVPRSRVEEALHPVLAGVLNAAGVTGPGETVTRTYRFSELTVVVTSERVVKHFGEAVWDDEFEEVEYADVTGLGVEEGSVASQLVIETTERPERIKVPNDEVRAVRDRVENALLAYHDVESYEAFEALVADGDDVESAGGDASSSFESDLDPIDLSGSDDDPDESTVDLDQSTADPVADSDEPVGSPDDAPDEPDAATATGAPASVAVEDAPGDETGDRADAGFEEFESATSAGMDESADAAVVEERLRALQKRIERQRELLDEQQAALEELAAELDQRR